MCRSAIALICLILSWGAAAQSCVPPVGAPAEPFGTLSAAAEEQLRLLLSQYAYGQNWTRHAEAIAAGFRAGDLVYGQSLKQNGSFKASDVARWRRSQAAGSRPALQASLADVLEQDRLTPDVIAWILDACLGKALWSRISDRGNCRFQFVAGVERGRSPIPATQVVLHAEGARCAAWPAASVTAKGASVECVRSGVGPVTVSLRTARGATTQQSLAPLPERESPPMPVLETVSSEPVVEVVRLDRALDFQLIRLGVGCPACRLYAADVRPSDPAAAILDVATVASNGAGWRRCPAGLACGVREFSPPDGPASETCSGHAVCRVWRLAETGADATDVIQLTVQTNVTRCVNCPPGMEFEAARAQWEADDQRARCAGK